METDMDYIGVIGNFKGNVIFCRFLSWFLLFEYLFERSDLKGSCDRVTILVYLVFLVEKYWFPCAELHANRLL